MSESFQPKIIKKYINVNTKFRPFVKDSQPKNTVFKITLPESITNVLSMKLKSFNAPNTEYTFSVTEINNSFDVISNGITTTIKVIPGRYVNPVMPIPSDSTLLLEQINVQLSPFDIRMIFIPELQKYAFTGNNITNIEINFDVQNNYIYNTFGWLMGFHHSYYSKDQKYVRTYPLNECDKQQKGLVSGIIIVGGNKYYLADAFVQLPNTSLYYMLYVDDYLGNVENAFYEGCFPSNNNAKNILAQVTTKYSYTHNTFYETDTNASFERVYTGPVTLSKLHIRLFDDNDRIAELNNADYTFLLELKVKM